MQIYGKRKVGRRSKQPIDGGMKNFQRSERQDPENLLRGLVSLLLIDAWLIIDAYVDRYALSPGL